MHGLRLFRRIRFGPVHLARRTRRRRWSFLAAAWQGGTQRQQRAEDNEMPDHESSLSHLAACAATLAGAVPP